MAKASEEGIHLKKKSFLHATKDTIVIFITTPSGSLVILIIISDAFLALFHLYIAV
jgi:hypothetical protein